MTQTIDRIRDKVRAIPDFPKKGILFRDITPVLGDPPTFKATIDLLAERYAATKPQQIVAVESRGFIFGAALAYTLGVGLTIVRKPGKLPGQTITETYQLEYGTDSLQIHADAIARGERCLVLDDLLATGGTAAATARLVERLGGTVQECLFVIELAALGGRAKLSWPVHSLLTF